MLCSRLSERVAKQHLFRQLAKLLDWDFLYEQTPKLYFALPRMPLEGQSLSFWRKLYRQQYPQ